MKINYITNITEEVGQTAASLGTSYGFLLDNFSSRSMGVEVSMALLLSKVNPKTIQLFGIWKSDTMLIYLRTTEK